MICGTVVGGAGPPSIWRWVADHGSRILSLTAEHVELAAVAVVVGLAISLPLSVLAYRRARLYPPITWVAGVLYTIPSIALFVVMIPVTGLSNVTVEIGLVSYTLLILVRNTVAGLRGISADLKESATGMGYTRRQLLWRVELPMAVPAIVAGVRVATVSTIGLVAVGFIVGKGAVI